MKMKGFGYLMAIVAGSCASLSAVTAKFASSYVDWRLQAAGYGGVILFNLVMWVFYVKSLKILTSLQTTVVNFATNFLVSGLAGLFIFKEMLPLQWFVGASLIVIGTFILSTSSKSVKSNVE